MKAWLGAVSLLTILVSADSVAQIRIPTVVQLPSEDFVWPWGRRRRDDLDRPEFTIYGGEQNFQCTLTGAFRISSRMRDFENQRQFEFDLADTLYFIQNSTYWLNYYYRSGDLQWASLNCVIPENEPSEEKTQERVDRALERAQRQRERRREREQSGSRE